MWQISIVLFFSPSNVSKILFFCTSSVVLSIFVTKTKSITANEANICGEKVTEPFLSLTKGCKKYTKNEISIILFLYSCSFLGDMAKTNLSNLLDGKSFLTPVVFDIFTTELKYGRISTTVFSNRISLPNYPREGLDVVILVTQRLNLQILPFPSVNTADPSLWCFFTTMQLEGSKTWRVNWIRFEKS